MRSVAWGVLLASWSGIALAADLPPPMMPAPPPVYVPVSAPTYNWTSIYLGGNVGYGFAKATATANAAAFGLAASASTSETLNGVLGGGQVGALYQFGYGVVGFESDFDGTGQSTSTTAGGVTATDKIPWVSTTRVRVGAAYDRVLFYLTGGGGWGQFQRQWREAAPRLRPRSGNSPGSVAAASNTASPKTCRRGSSICMSTPATLP
jgi:outer membrane immunogenic protein